MSPDTGLSISQLARAGDCSIEAVRYYERLGLLSPPSRSVGGHRHYDQRHVLELCFIRKARDLGFSIERVRELMELAAQPSSPWRAARDILNLHLSEVRARISELTALEERLNGFAADDPSTPAGDSALLRALGPVPRP
jgi:DNA-binding transcriptional MerR regulator